MEDLTMNLPNDPVMLLSVVNTYLRDKYENIDDLCKDLDVDKNNLISKLNSINYEYDLNLNQFK